jgi:hypothetical protein
VEEIVCVFLSALINCLGTGPFVDMFMSVVYSLLWILYQMVHTSVVSPTYKMKRGAHMKLLTVSGV